MYKFQIKELKFMVELKKKRKKERKIENEESNCIPKLYSNICRNR